MESELESYSEHQSTTESAEENLRLNQEYCGENASLCSDAHTGGETVSSHPTSASKDSRESPGSEESGSPANSVGFSENGLHGHTLEAYLSDFGSSGSSGSDLGSMSRSCMERLICRLESPSLDSAIKTELQTPEDDEGDRCLSLFQVSMMTASIADSLPCTPTLLNRHAECITEEPEEGDRRAGLMRETAGEATVTPPKPSGSSEDIADSDQVGMTATFSTGNREEFCNEERSTCGVLSDKNLVEKAAQPVLASVECVYVRVINWTKFTDLKQGALEVLQLLGLSETESSTVKTDSPDSDIELLSLSQDDSMSALQQDQSDHMRQSHLEPSAHSIPSVSESCEEDTHLTPVMDDKTPGNNANYLQDGYIFNMEDPNLLKDIDCESDIPTSSAQNTFEQGKFGSHTEDHHRQFAGASCTPAEQFPGRGQTGPAFSGINTDQERFAPQPQNVQEAVHSLHNKIDTCLHHNSKCCTVHQELSATSEKKNLKLAPQSLQSQRREQAPEDLQKTVMVTGAALKEEDEEIFNLYFENEKHAEAVVKKGDHTLDGNPLHVTLHDEADSENESDESKRRSVSSEDGESFRRDEPSSDDEYAADQEGKAAQSSKGGLASREGEYARGNTDFMSNRQHESAESSSSFSSDNDRDKNKGQYSSSALAQMKPREEYDEGMGDPRRLTDGYPQQEGSRYQEVPSKALKRQTDGYRGLADSGLVDSFRSPKKDKNEFKDKERMERASSNQYSGGSNSPMFDCGNLRPTAASSTKKSSETCVTREKHDIAIKLEERAIRKITGNPVLLRDPTTKVNMSDWQKKKRNQRKQMQTAANGGTGETMNLMMIGLRHLCHSQ
ncbi:protein starmaker-like [Littorina saxatilis]|uniref:protein starmaker-like n=1 Tax=Littorina saxatilis TaxID=31220 RepID=UPI0038B69950